MNVLVACECSGRVRSEFRARGHNAFSCDLLPAEDGGEHILCEHDLHLLDIIEQGAGYGPWSKSAGPWDLLIGFPPCTFLCNSSVHLLKSKRPQEKQRWQEMQQGARFFRALWNSPVPRKALENPIMHHYATAIIGARHSQTLQPYEFGDDASKRTCLWLSNLPPLIKTGPFIAPRLVNGKPRWANQTDSGQNKLPPSLHRAADRARTYPGIARAMAAQWG